MSNDLLARIKKNSTLKDYKLKSLADSTLLNDTDNIVTDMPILNLAFSGDLNKGFRSGMIQFAGPSKHFKTNLSLICVKAFLKKYPEGICLFFDSEFGITKEYLEAQNIDSNRMIHIPITNIEELRFELVNQLEGLTKEDKVIILIDSIGNLASKKELEDSKNENSAQDMSRPKMLKALGRIVTPHLTLKDIPLIAINHVYQEMGLFPKAIVSGGCLVAGSKVQTESGLKNIEDIKIGDFVDSKYGLQEVEYIWNPETLADGNPECYEIEFEDGSKVTCSAEHKFIVDGQWVEAKNLSENDECETL